jgi:secreted trypsin-like serine protease
MKGRNLKFLAIFAILSLVKASGEFTPPGEINVNSFRNFAIELSQATQGRIASGVAAKHGEVDEFCYLSIQFLNKLLTCGCYLVDSRYILTSASCLME